MRCKNCNIKFEVKKFNQKYCNAEECQNLMIKGVLKKVKVKKDREQRKDKKERLERLKTREDYFQETLKAFNTYIRARDKNQPCISCDKPSGTYRLTSGHYYPQGTYRNIALDERNAHSQCWYNCNRNKSGNLLEYRPRLIKKIGLEAVEQLDIDAQQLVAKYTIPELKELKELYKQKLKELLNN